MKRFISILTLLAIAFVAKANGLTGAPLDSTAYVTGYTLTASMLAEESDILREKSDYEEFLRGLEVQPFKNVSPNDSSYVFSYARGRMHGLSLIGYAEEMSSAQMSYILEGLRKVAENKIVLPADTIKANAIIKKYQNAGIKATELEGDAQCEFFTAFGLMDVFMGEMVDKMMENIQEKFHSIGQNTYAKYNRQAYVAGTADFLEACLGEKAIPAYEMGKTMAFSANLFGNGESYSQSFIDGAKAALNLGDQLIEEEQISEYIRHLYKQNMADADNNDDKKGKKWTTYQNALKIEMCENYAVDWNVTIRQIAPDTAPVAEIFRDVLTANGIEENKCEGILMAFTSDEKGYLYKNILPAIKKMPLTEDYKWFCSRSYDNELTIGIMKTANPFKAKAAKASMALEIMQGKFIMPWTFDTQGISDWTLFTKENIGKYVAIDINDNFVSAPKIENQITDGQCTATGLAPKLVNKLFKGAKMCK